MVTIEKITNYANKIKNGEHESIRPGQAYEFSEACTEGDMVWQGDLGIGITSSKPPKGYVKSKQVHLNLIPNSNANSTVGSRHCLASAEGVTMWLPKEWNEESLDGPFLQLKNGAKITHPIHGDVTVPACFKNVQIVYQREWDQEQARERRAKD